MADDASNYLDVMRGLAQDFHNPGIRKRIVANIQRVNPLIQSIEPFPILNPTKADVAYEAKGQLVSLDLKQESDGLRRFYAHLLALYQSPAKLTLIFEEPENAIFPGALSLLAEEFKAAPRENRGQVIITTHSPTLLDSFDVESIRVVEMRDGSTVAGRVATEQVEAVKERLIRTGELLTVEEPRMEGEPAEMSAP